MSKSRIASCLACLGLVLAMFIGLVEGTVVSAADGDSDNPTLSPSSQEEAQSEEEPVEFFAKFPTLEGAAGDTFEFEVYIRPKTSEYKTKYNFNITVPNGWEANIWGSYPKKQITAIDFRGEQISSETIDIKVFPLPGKSPEPGEYTITVEMASEKYQASEELTAVVTASYKVDMLTETGRLNTQAKAGEDNHVSILLVNTGTATIEDIALSAEAPEDWEITFNPEKIGVLEAGLKQEVDVVIQPPKKAIAGDYLVTLRANGEKGSDALQLRVTVLAATTWGWAGVGMVVGVIAGLVVLFRRLGRR